MSCSLPIAQIQRYCTGDLTPPERLSVKQHIADCPTCLERYNALVEDYIHGKGPERVAAEAQPTLHRQPIRDAVTVQEAPETPRVRVQMPGWMRQALAPAVMALSFAFVVAVFVAVGTGAYDLVSTPAPTVETRAEAVQAPPRPAEPTPVVSPVSSPKVAVAAKPAIKPAPAPVRTAARQRRTEVQRVLEVRPVQPLASIQPARVAVSPVAAPAAAFPEREPAPKVALIHGLGAEPMVVPVARPVRPEDVVVRTEPRIRPSVGAVLIYGAASEPLVVPVGGHEPDHLMVAGS